MTWTHPGGSCLSGAACGSACCGLGAAVLSDVELSSWADRKANLCSEEIKNGIESMTGLEYRLRAPSAGQRQEGATSAERL